MHYNHTFNLDSLCKDENYIIIFYMAKTKGLRKVKHGKRHSRKKYGGGEEEETLTKEEANNRKEEIINTIKNKQEENRLNNEKLVYLNEYIEIQNIPWYQRGKTKRMEALKSKFAGHRPSNIRKSDPLGDFIQTMGLIKNIKDLNESKEKIEYTITENVNQLKELKEEKNLLEGKLEQGYLYDWKCPESLSIPHTINNSKTKGKYKGDIVRITEEYGYKKCVADGQGTWTSDDGVNTIEGRWDKGIYVDPDTKAKQETTNTESDNKCPHEKFSMQAIKDIDCNKKNRMLLAIHPDKNPGDCNQIATEKMKELNKKCDQKHKEPAWQKRWGGKKSKKTQRKRKRKHRASSRH